MPVEKPRTGREELRNQDGLQKPFADSLRLILKLQRRNDLKRFLTQSDLNIHDKLLKEANAPTLDNRLRLAQTLYYGREKEEKRQKED